jgi:hypothetical protein
MNGGCEKYLNIISIVEGGGVITPRTIIERVIKDSLT